MGIEAGSPGSPVRSQTLYWATLAPKDLHIGSVYFVATYFLLPPFHKAKFWSALWSQCQKLGRYVVGRKRFREHWFQLMPIISRFLEVNMVSPLHSRQYSGTVLCIKLVQSLPIYLCSEACLTSGKKSDRIRLSNCTVTIQLARTQTELKDLMNC
jgi:hypothetical protein